MQIVLTSPFHNILKHLLSLLNSNYVLRNVGLQLNKLTSYFQETEIPIVSQNSYAQNYIF